MRVDRVRVVSTTGANRRPHSGDAWFSDGRAFGWMLLPEGGVALFTTRKHCGEVRFQSPARATALAAYLELN